jgi:hypothetical protein
LTPLAFGEELCDNAGKRAVSVAESKAAIVAMLAGDVLREVERAANVGDMLRRHFAGPWFRLR